jgi:hypothetical protein
MLDFPPRSSETISITAITMIEIDGTINSRYMGNLLCNKHSVSDIRYLVKKKFDKVAK